MNGSKSGGRTLTIFGLPRETAAATSRAASGDNIRNTTLMNFWIAYASLFVAWWALYFFVSDKMTDAGIGWINAINPQSDAKYSLASKLTIAKHIVFAVLMIVVLVFLARHYPSCRNWSYGLGLLWNVFNGLVVGVAGLVVIVALWSAGV